MMPMQESPAPPVDRDAVAVQGEATYLTNIERRLVPYFGRSEPPAACYNPCARPAQFGQLPAVLALGRTEWGGNALWLPTFAGAWGLVGRRVRDESSSDIIPNLGYSDAVLMTGETELLKKWRQFGHCGFSIQRHRGSD